MTPLLLTVLVASLAGSLHCAGMCGGFVAFYAGSDPSTGGRRALIHAAYNGARLIGYATLGIAAGSIGQALDLAGSMAGFQRLAAPVAGVTMIVWGLLALARARGFDFFKTSASPGPVGRLVKRAFRNLAGRPPLARAAFVGLLSAVLPCGWLWAFLVTAAGTGHPLSGALVMAAFWLGTVPILSVLGFGTQLIAGPIRRHAPTITAMLLVILGTVAIFGRPATASEILQRRADADSATLEEQVRNLDADEAGCCDDE